MIRGLPFVIAAIVITALFAAVDFFAAFFIYEWAGGDFGGYGAAAHSPERWALPAWLTLTAAFVALDIVLLRRFAHRWRMSNAHRVER